MFKKIVGVLLITSMLAPAISQAVDLGSMFKSLSGSDSMSTTDAAGIYKSASRIGVSAGGYEMRTPTKTLTNLYSITPPSLSYGCNGISAHFGGFSFITGSQIEGFIKNIVQGAPGLVLQLAIKSLCPQCEAVLQVMQNLAQQAAKFSADSCSAGKALEKMAENALMPGGSATGVCRAKTTESNGSSDWLDALNSACISAQQSVESITKYFDGKSGPDGKPLTATATKEALASGRNPIIGNSTWMALRAMRYNPEDPADLKQMILLMNLLGTEIIGPDGNSITPLKSAPSTSTASNYGSSNSNVPTAKVDDSLIAPPRINTNYLYDLYMCGTPTGSAADNTFDYKQTRAVRTYCNRFFTVDWSSQVIYDCADDYQLCTKLKEVAVKDANVIQGEGMLYRTNMTLRNGVELVRTNNGGKAIDWTADDKKQLAALIAAAPYPLYQAINAAAVYPAAADDLMDSLSVMVAELMSYKIIEDMMSPNGRTGNAQVASPAVVRRMYEAMGSIRAANVEQRQLIGQSLALQEGLSRRIFQINQTIQKQVMSDDFFGNNQFSTAVTKKAN